jgi:hypothetical protein
MKLDQTMWPIVVFSAGERTTDDEWRQMFAHYDDFYTRRQLFHPITDSTAARSFPTAGQRKLIADLSREHEERSRRWCVGGAVVLTSTIARGVLTTITWLAPPVYKLTYHGTFASALDQAVRALEARGVTVPAQALRARSSRAASASR